MRVLVTGGTGFVGSRVVQAFLARPGFDVRVLSRQAHSLGRAECVVGDLTDEVAVDRALEGIDGVVHAASLVQGARELVEQSNAQGTRALMEATARAKIARVVYLSTTAVYGSGPHRGLIEGALAPAPESIASASRLVAEETVRATGGVVIRAALTYGVGDRWFVPSLIRGAFALGGLPDGGRARLSLIDVERLGEAAVEVLLRHDALQGRALHAAHPTPVTVADLLDRLGDATGLQLPAVAVSREVAAATAEKLGFTPHQLSLIADDHWYDTSALWNSIGLREPSGFVLNRAQGEWYRGVGERLLRPSH